MTSNKLSSEELTVLRIVRTFKRPYRRQVASAWGISTLRYAALVSSLKFDRYITEGGRKLTREGELQFRLT